MLVLISKAKKTIEVDFDAMPENAKAYIIAYGLKQKLNDAGASATKKSLGAEEAAEQSFAMAENILASLMEGDITVRAAAATQTLEERVFTRVLRALFKAQLKRAVAKEADQSDEALLNALALSLKKDVDHVRNAIQKRADAEIAIERQRMDVPDVEL